MNTPVKPKRCPCCGQPTAVEIYIDRRLFRLSAMQQRLFDLIKRAKDGVSTSDCITWLYGNREPASENIISVMVRHINQKLEKYNQPIRIRSTQGRNAIYRLVDSSEG